MSNDSKLAPPGDPRVHDSEFVLGQLWGIVQHLPARLDQIEDSATARYDSINQKLDIQQREINHVKNKQYWLSGVTAAAGVFITFVATHLGIKT